MRAKIFRQVVLCVCEMGCENGAAGGLLEGEKSSPIFRVVSRWVLNAGDEFILLVAFLER